MIDGQSNSRKTWAYEAIYRVRALESGGMASLCRLWRDKKAGTGSG